MSVDRDDLYDWEPFERRTAPRPPVRGRGGLAASALAAALWAIDDVVMGAKQRTPVVEEAAIPTPDPLDRVVVHLVRGDPRSSWARVLTPPGDS